MKPLVSPSDFPSASTFCYLNAANVSLTYNKAKTANEKWFEDVSLNGSNNFTEKKEESAFDQLHKTAADFVRAEPYEIAGGSSATELLSSLAWSISPKRGKSCFYV